MAAGFCPQCGTQRQGALRYCASCGFDFWQAARPDGGQSRPEPESPPAPQVSPTSEPRPPVKQSSTLAKILGGLVLIGIVWVVLQALGSGGSSSDNSGGGVGNDKAEPSSALDVSNVSYTKETIVGGSIDVLVTAANPGAIRTGEVKLQFSDLDKIADIVGCTPTCSVDKFLGTYATVPGVAAGGSATWTVEWVATKVGAEDWSLCVYEPATSGNQVYCGSGTTVVR